MRIIRRIEEMQQETERVRMSGKSIGLVPTMGYLHEGHVSLVQLARTSSDVVTMSIFVNPTQFAPTEDLSRYPRDFERDRQTAEKAGVDFLFVPDAAEVYAGDYSTFIEEHEASRILEGKFRPTHFRGVTTIVGKLLNICRPDVAVFGQKDAQQAFIVGKMIRDLNFDVKMMIAPIVRERDGLAMSSRNIYLSKDERAGATVLYEALRYAEREIGKGSRSPGDLRKVMETMMYAKGASSIDYIAFVSTAQFREIEVLAPPSVTVAVAARFGSTRLIDNIVVEIQESGSSRYYGQ